MTPAALTRARTPSSWTSKAPTASYRDFIMGEVRYNSLTRSFPERAEKLFANAEKYAVEKYERPEEDGRVIVPLWLVLSK